MFTGHETIGDRGVHEHRGVPIVWKQDFDGRRRNPNIGRGSHGIVSVGTVSTHSYAGRTPGEWNWSMVATGEGAGRRHRRGIAPTKAAAIEACNACYIDLVNIGRNCERAVWHHVRLAKSTEAWERRGDEAFLALPQAERDAALERIVAEMLDERERRLLGI
jgi:hypothetical protein